MFKVKKKVSLKKYSNYKIGGPARYFFEARTSEDIKGAIEWAKINKQKYFILGGGTNILISDEGFKGLVIKINIKDLKVKGNKIYAGAGVLMKDLLNFTIKNKLSGLEWAGGLPGTFGGAIRGNAGAFGGEIKDSIETVEHFNVKNQRVFKHVKKHCAFGYRSSSFKAREGESVILAATLRLKKGNSEKIKQLVNERIKYRKDRQPLEYPNVGSIFKNVDIKNVPKVFLRKFRHKIKTDPFPVMPTAVIIAEAGLKGLKVGGAEVSRKHSNFIVNTRNAKATHVKTLIRKIKNVIYKKLKIKLEEEVQIL